MFKKIKEFFSGDKGTKRALLGWVIVITIIALCEFLFYKGNNLFNGWQIVKNQSFGEWFRMIFWSLLAGVSVWGFFKYARKTQDVRGNSIRAFAIILATFLGIAFGKGCTDKANDGVTSDKGRPVKTQPIDDGRVPAEDLLPKK